MESNFYTYKREAHPTSGLLATRTIFLAKPASLDYNTVGFSKSVRRLKAKTLKI